MKEYFSNILHAFVSLARGFRITGRTFLKVLRLKSKELEGRNYGRGPVTNFYPESAAPVPEGSRNRLFMYQEGCISCNQCAVICPVDCISIESRRRNPDENPEARTPERFKSKPMRLKLMRFEIDEALCCFCGLRTEVCPTDCLVHTPVFEYSKYDRDQLVYNYLDFRDANPAPTKSNGEP